MYFEKAESLASEEWGIAVPNQAGKHSNWGILLGFYSQD